MTTAPDALDVAHIKAPRMPATLTRMEIAQNYVIANASLPALSAGADLSYALAHEQSDLQPKVRALAHADDFDARARGLLLRTASNLPPGWSLTPDDTIRHLASGLECPTSIALPEEDRRFLMTDVAAWDDKNLDVGCIYRADNGTRLVLYASFWPQMSLDDNVAASVDAIAAQFDLHGDLPISVATLDPEDGNPVFENIESPRAGAFDIGVIDGVHYKTALWLVKTYGWHVKARATYANEDMSAELISAIMFAMSHLNVRAKNMNEPMAEGSEV